MPAVVAGVDVGGTRKGFHAVALRDGRHLERFASPSAAEVVDWCLMVGAQAVGVDAPCRWSGTGRARPAERELARAGISAFATPSREAAQGRAFYRWMTNGAELFERLEAHYPLFDGRRHGPGPLCFETFPQAVACALAGRIASAKEKATVRRGLLREAGIDPAPLTNMDWVDAALCALTAHRFRAGRYRAYGEAGEGFIVVPA